MVHCSILGCKSDNARKLENITYHRFPKEPTLRSRWIKATGRSDWQPTNHSRICSRHFENKWLRRTKNATFLNDGAVPKLFIQNSGGENFINLLEPILTSSQTTQSLPTCNCKCHTHTMVVNKVVVSKGTQTTPFHDISEKIGESTQLTETVQDISEKSLTEYTRKTKLANKCPKKIIVLRAKTWRYKKNYANLSSVIADLKSRHFTNQETAVR